MKHEILITAICLVVACSCNPPDWEEHYENHPESVDMELWDAVKSESRFSEFTSLITSSGLDTLFNKKQSHTLFIPNNEAMSLLTSEDTTGNMRQILLYHISNTVFLTSNVSGYRKLQNLTGKFAVVEKFPGYYCYDLIPIEYSSPLYLDGVYHELAEPAIPRPNLYEFTERYSSVIKDYIDLTDSAYLDKSSSKPLGFDEFGNTVYDSVFGSVNRFERDYFPVSQEYRNRTATFVLFTQDQYIEALDEMGQLLGGSFTGYDDIPEIWQFQVLLPALLENSLFDNVLDYVEFQDTMISVTGDTVYIEPENIDPHSKFLCSNGVTYTYLDFEVPDYLYKGELRIEGEDLLDSIGPSTWAWKPGVKIDGISVRPTKQYVEEASGHYLANVSFPDRGYEEEWSITFSFTNVFPMRYRLEWGSSFRPSGNYSVYANGVILEYNDRYGRPQTVFDTYELRQVIRSVTGEKFVPAGNLNRRDYWVEDITDFGDIEIKILYTGPGSQDYNGFNLDYVTLTPAEE